MNSNLSPSDLLTAFVLEQIETQPIEKRIWLYRSLAHETKDSILAQACRRTASQLEEVVKSHNQLLLEFRRRTSS